MTKDNTCKKQISLAYFRCALNDIEKLQQKNSR